MSAAAEALVRRFYAEFDKTKGIASRDLVAPDLTVEVSGIPGSLDLAAFEQFFSTFFTGFPDLHHEIEDLIAEDDTVVARLVLRGTHGGSFMGVRATGKRIAVEAVSGQR